MSWLSFGHLLLLAVGVYAFILGGALIADGTENATHSTPLGFAAFVVFFVTVLALANVVARWRGWTL